MFRNPLIHPVTFEIFPSTDGCCPKIEQKTNEKNLQLDTNQFVLFKYGCVNVGLGLREIKFVSCFAKIRCQCFNIPSFPDMTYVNFEKKNITLRFVDGKNMSQQNSTW